MYQSNQHVMEQPPAFISEKDLAYLTDAMSWELLAMKKCNHFARECNDQEIKQVIVKTGKMHEKHYKMLLNNLSSTQSGINY